MTRAELDAVLLEELASCLQRPSVSGARPLLMELTEFQVALRLERRLATEELGRMVELWQEEITSLRARAAALRAAG